MTILAANQIRGSTHDITITDAAGATIIPAAADKVRAIIGRLSELGGTAELPTGAKLIVTSGSPTANGSSFSKDTPTAGINRLRLDAQDLTFAPGTYTLLIDFFDNADAMEWKTVDRQVLILGETF